MANHHFDTGSFDSEFWVDNKALFTKLLGVDVELTSAGAFDWVFSDSAGNEVQTLRHANEHGGWASVDFVSLGLFGDYSIGFRYASPGTKQIKQGDVSLPLHG